MEDNTQNKDKTTNTTTSDQRQTDTRSKIPQRRVQFGHNNGGDRFSGRKFEDKPKSEFDVQVISTSRVTKVTGGGKRMRMAAFVVVGNRNGKIGVGSSKGPDVKVAQEKAIEMAKRNMFTVVTKGTTIPHSFTVKFGAAKVMLKPARPGTGIVAGGAVRKVLELVGIKDVLTKQIGTNNKYSNAYAVVKALKFMSK